MLTLIWIIYKSISFTGRISFHDLSPTPHKERGSKQRKKTIKDPLLTGEENLKIVADAHQKTLKKEELEEEKNKIVKQYVKNRQRGRGRGRARGVKRGGYINNPKL